MTQLCPVSMRIRTLAARSRWTEREAEEILEAGRRSGLTWCGFARVLGIDVARLYRWRRVLESTDHGSEPTSTGFVSLLPVDRPSSFSGFRIVLENGRQVSFSPDVSVELALAVIKAAAC